MANATEKRLLRVLDHIHDNPTGDLSLDALADVAAMSRFHFHRLFRAMTGETTAQTVRRMRMHRAAVALVQSTLPLAAIASSIGYPDATSFTRAFRDSYATSPAAFRRQGALRPVPSFLQKGPLMYPIDLRTLPAQPLAAMPHKGPYPLINHAFEKLFAALAARNLLAETGYMIGVFYDDPAATAPEALTSHAAVQVPETLPCEAPLQRITLPAGRHAVLTFTGPYSGLPAAYDQLYGVWLPASGETPADAPSFEVYRNSPMDTPQEALITEIHLPLR